MTEQEMKARIERSRELIDWSREEYQSDQTLKKPQPPLVKAPMTENPWSFRKTSGICPWTRAFYGSSTTGGATGYLPAAPWIF